MEEDILIKMNDIWELYQHVEQCQHDNGSYALSNTQHNYELGVFGSGESHSEMLSQITENDHMVCNSPVTSLNMPEENKFENEKSLKRKRHDDVTENHDSSNRKVKVEKWDDDELVALMALEKWTERLKPAKKYTSNKLICEMGSEFLKEEHLDAHKIKLKLYDIKKRTKLHKSKVFSDKVDTFIETVLKVKFETL